MLNSAAERQTLRKRIRQQRQTLSLQFQQNSAKQLALHATSLALVQQSEHIALYLSNDGELDTSLLIDALWQQNKHLYLPVLHPVVAGYLLFVKYDSNTELVPNRFGILEPKATCQNLIPVNELDLVFTPLVAFDANGNRLGMGGGFYDRTLSQLTQIKTQVVGLAHDCQQVEYVPTEPWDIPMKHILTPSTYWSF